jgi:hypothetical protein
LHDEKIVRLPSTMALALGSILALTQENPFAHLGKRISAKLLQVCVVFLGWPQPV